MNRLSIALLTLIGVAVLGAIYGWPYNVTPLLQPGSFVLENRITGSEWRCIRMAHD